MSTFCLTGGDGNDTLIAQTAGGSGPWADGGPGNDRLLGGPLDDDLKGSDGGDVITGGKGPDTIDGGAGNDRITGGAGNDRITGGAGHNTISAGSGNDLISANDGSRERIDCGPGDDLVHADRRDRLVRCELVTFRPNPYPRISPHRGTLTTLFALSFIAPAGTEPGATDSGSADYDFKVISAPSRRCELFFKDATPLLEMGDRYRAHFTISPRRRACRGSYKVAVTFKDSNLGVECNSASGEPKPRNTSGGYSDCPFTATVGYFSFGVG
jgi:hypothetical protein